jgi:hypothetical protein
MATTPSLHDQRDAALAEYERLQGLADHITSSGISAKNQAIAEFYENFATELSEQARQDRADLDTRLGQIAMAEKFNLNNLFEAWLDRSTADATCGGIATVASNVTPNPGPNQRGVYDMPVGTRVTEKYRADSFAQFVDAVVQKRADRVRDAHIQTLRDGAAAAGKSAEAAARARAAAGG